MFRIVWHVHPGFKGDRQDDWHSFPELTRRFCAASIVLSDSLEDQVPRQKQRVVSTLLTTPSPASEARRLFGVAAEFHIFLLEYRSAFYIFWPVISRSCDHSSQGHNDVQILEIREKRNCDREYVWLTTTCGSLFFEALLAAQLPINTTIRIPFLHCLYQITWRRLQEISLYLKAERKSLAMNC